jgi:prephenate dehydrogenase
MTRSKTVDEQTRMKSWDTVAVVGVGLIGASVGLALRERGLARNVVGVGRNKERLGIAEQRGAVTSTTTEWSEGVRNAEVIVVCTPVAHIVDHVRQVRRSCGANALITDAGSTKGRICREIESQPVADGVFVGSHPMAGSHKSGPEHARADLFEGSFTVITPTERTREEHIEQIQLFWQLLGSDVVRASPEEHDRAAAAISHLPHLVASVLSACTSPDHLALAGSGWRDTTRTAAGDAELWRQILADNRHHVLQSLDNFAKVLAEFRHALAAEDQTELTRLLEVGKRNRDSLGS